MLEKKIKELEFGLMSPEMIRKMSVVEIKTPETYDKDGYPVEEGLMDLHMGVISPGMRCKTDGQTMKNCPGYFGHLEMVRPIIHPKFSINLEKLLMSTCRKCGKILVPAEKIKAIRSKPGSEEMAKKIRDKAKTIKKCPHCSKKDEKISLDKPTNFYLGKERIYPAEIREWVERVSDEDALLLGFKPDILRPEWLIMTVLPVPPITIRPSITLETGMKSEDDLTHKLVDIIRINTRLKDNIDAGAPQLIIEDLWDLLQYHVTTYFDNQTAGVPPAKHRSGRALRTLVQRLKGKKGRFRYNLTGKRVNFAARSTISPDPFISINEIGVPQRIADDLTVPEKVLDWNKKDLQKLIKETDKAVSVLRTDQRRKIVTEETRKEIAKELDLGFIVERKLQDGDIVLFNRQPSLHRLSMLAHKVRIMDGKTFRLNPVVCKPYNADFDGDEMNMHVPQTQEGIAEARELMYVQEQVISPRYGAPVIVLDEDGITGTYILTMDQTEFSEKEAFKLFYELGFDKFPKPDRGKNYSGKLIFSQLLPKDLNLSYKSKTFEVLEKLDSKEKTLGEKSKHWVHIKNGKLISGTIDENSLGEISGVLIDTLAREYPHDVISNFYNKLNKIIGWVITIKGLTVGLDEYEINDKIKKLREKAVKEELDEAEKLVKEYKKGSLQLIPGRTLDESFETKMLQLGAKVKGKVEKELMKEKLESVLQENPVLNTSLMIIAGSRGNATNLMNIAGFWGQASVRAGRPKSGFSNRILALSQKGDVGATAGGFIEQSLLEGLKGSEYFYHSIGGRQGEVDTGVSTKVSGYLYRRLANSLKELSVKNDATVRTSANKIVQLKYGEDGVFPMKTKKGKAIDVAKVFKKIKQK